MDEISRVKNIKERFENISNIGESNEGHKNGQLKNLRIIQTDIKSIKPAKGRAPYTNAKEVVSNVRPNIKRKPAFRRDFKIPMRNNEITNKNQPSIVSRRVHLFNNMDDIENLSNGLHSESDPVKSSVIKLLEPKPGPMSDPTLLYSKVKKTTKNSKTAQLSGDAAASNNSIDEKPSNTSFHEINKKIGSKVNKENNLRTSNSKSSSDGSNELSDTLKRILKCPLPAGPPPQKPPRTFASNSESSSPPETKIQQPQRSKTESEIKLKKIENALVKHQNLVFSPNSVTRKVSIGSPPKSMIEKCAGINKNKRRSSDKGTLNQLSCLSDLNCATRSKSVPYFPVSFPPSSISTSAVQKNDDCHIYEDPASLNLSAGSTNKETEANSLYYMSTPIESILGSPARESVSEAHNANVKLNCQLGTPLSDEFNVKLQNDISIDNKIKLWMNEAYSKSWTKTSDASSDSDSVFSASQDDFTSNNKEEKSVVDQYNQLTLTRKGYCQRVASRAISRNQSVLAQIVSDYKHLFECLLLIGLNLDAHNEKVPYIKMKYPSHVNVPQSIEHMCFPDAHDWYNKSSEKTTDEDMDEDRCYVIPLTNEAGLRKYAYCRRIKPEGESFSLPLSYCILSGHKANEFYFSVLEEVENRHGQSEIEFSKFIKELYENRFPLKGQGIKIASFSEGGKEKAKDDILMRPCDTRLEDLRLAKTLAYLKINTFLLIFSSLLLERKVILLSSCISKLSTCIEGLQVALLPFEWQHTLITVVPSNLISVSDLCDAPTPYLIGLLKPKNNSTRVLSYFNNKTQVLVVDLDEKKALRKVGDENSILPNHLAKGLKNALQLAHSSEMHTNNLLACEAFTRLFVEAIGHYRRYFVFSGSDRNCSKSFQKEAFVKAAPSHQIRMFLEWFVETAAFSMFINVRLQNNSHSRGLFEQRCNEYFEELSRSKYEKNNKLNKTVKQIGDLIKDWTNTASLN